MRICYLTGYGRLYGSTSYSFGRTPNILHFN